MNTKTLIGLLLVCCTVEALGDPYYTGNLYSPYPPGCVTHLSKQGALYGDNVARFWSGRLSLEVVHKVQSTDDSRNLGPVDVNMYRVGCAEPNRSVIVVEFKLTPESVDPRRAQLVLPSFFGSAAWDSVPFELKAEPNGWGQSMQQQSLTKQSFGDYTGGWEDPRVYTWSYVLDLGPVGAFWRGLDVAEYYNGRFALELFRNGAWAGMVVDVPATSDVLNANPDLPLNGRLTGNWVEEGAADQGFVLSFSNPVPSAGVEAAEPENADLSVFLSWFTFDLNGDLLWLTGVGRFPQGATEVTLPIERASQGQFLGSQVAERTVIGNARLRATHCNELELDYDLASLGLGTGNLRLQRLFALEIAGYPCRDYTARLNSLSPQSTY